MKEDSIPVVVIGRQFGSGGRSVGKLLAKRLGWAYYDTELLSQAAEKLGFDKKIFALHDEKRPSPLRSLLQGMFGLADNFHDVSICEERMYLEQSKTIREICHSPCVIVGRTADYILRDNPALVSVFLHSPAEYRAVRLIERKEAEDFSEAIEKLKKYDRCRENYYNFYTGGQNWGKASNYDLCLDSSMVSDEEIVNIIIKLLHKK